MDLAAVRCADGTTATLLFLLCSAAAAHPFDEVVQGAYITLAPGEAHLELDLTPGVEVVDVLLRSLDANADERITETEARAYAESVLKQSTLMLDGKAAVWRLQKISVPPHQNLKQQGGTLRIYAVAARVDRVGTHTLQYNNRYQPATSQCIANIFLQPGTSWQYRVTGQQRSDDGRQLTVRYNVTRP